MKPSKFVLILVLVPWQVLAQPSSQVPVSAGGQSVVKSKVYRKADKVEINDITQLRSPSSLGPDSGVSEQQLQQMLEALLEYKRHAEDRNHLLKEYLKEE